MKKQIVLLPGDGIGKEVISCASKVLQKVNEKFHHQFSYSYGLIGHSAIKEEKIPLPDTTLNMCLQADAVLLGAVGHPMYDKNPALKIRPEQGLLKLRKELGLYANIRPIEVFEELIDASNLKPEIVKNADILFFRELTGGIYFGEPRQKNTETALDTMVYSKKEILRIARLAFETAKKRKKRICSVDKANVLASSKLWRETVNELSQEYPQIKVTHMYIDNAAMQLIKNPKQFDIILTENMFGDILTDEASQISGSLGMLPSASIGKGIGLYEPIHGSAPDIEGKNIANPLAAILSVAMMFEYSFTSPPEANYIRNSIKKVIQKGYRTQDIATDKDAKKWILGTDEMTSKIIEVMDAN